MSKSQDKLEFEVMDTKALKECAAVARSAVDKAVRKGCYTLDETEKVLLSLNSLVTSVEVLEKYQSFVAERVRASRESQEKKAEVTVTDSSVETSDSGKQKVVYA